MYWIYVMDFPHLFKEQIATFAKLLLEYTIHNEYSTS